MKDSWYMTDLFLSFGGLNFLVKVIFLYAFSSKPSVHCIVENPVCYWDAVSLLCGFFTCKGTLSTQYHIDWVFRDVSTKILDWENFKLDQTTIYCTKCNIN